MEKLIGPVATLFIRTHTIPIVLGLFLLASTSGIIWLYEAGMISFIANPKQSVEVEFSALQSMQDKVNELAAKISMLEEQLAAQTLAVEQRTQVAGTKITSTNQNLSNNQLTAKPQNTMVNINSATAVQLETLPGIGPSKAQAIIQYRTQQGSFSTKDDLKKVKGIGESIYQKLESLIEI